MRSRSRSSSENLSRIVACTSCFLLGHDAQSVFLLLPSSRATSAIAALLAACAANPAPIAPEVPQSLRVPDRLTVSHEIPATGVQIYECLASKADASRFEWVFKAPEAELFDTAGHRIGKHYGGPTWE